MLKRQRTMLDRKPATLSVTPAPHAEDVRAPRPITFEDWAQLAPDERAPLRGLAMVELGNHQLVCVIIDTEAQQPVWIMEAPLDHLSALSRLIVVSGSDKETAVVIRGERSLCPPWCPPGGEPSGGGGDEPGILIARARLIELALTAVPVRVVTPTGEILALATR